jgi:acyl-[acyl-carrier-protein]-phospholipid O-acyltransferase/long-chain-fatty-acid--[acyl-carrier-protein] ligase
VLSHRNVLSNRHQLASVVDISPKDVVLNALPVFHSFGLTGGLLLPLLSGVRTFLYPSPLHYRTVPEIAYGINATILFGTDTFLAGYARVATLRFLFRPLRLCGSRARQTRNTTCLVREVRHPHSRGLWHDRNVTGARGQHADAFQGRAP